MRSPGGGSHAAVAIAAVAGDPASVVMRVIIGFLLMGTSGAPLCDARRIGARSFDDNPAENGCYVDLE
jgi:hypothetical protein